MRVCGYFYPIRTNRTYGRPNCGSGKSKFEIVYYRQIYGCPEKLSHIRGNFQNQVKK